MKKTLVAILFLAMALPAFAQTPPAAAVANAESVVWFEQVSEPLRFNNADAPLDFIRALRQGLLDGRKADELVALFPEDPHPRAIFLTLGDGIWPARTYFAVARSGREALRTILEDLPKQEKKKTQKTIQYIKYTIEDAKKEKRALPGYWQEKLDHPDRWDSLTIDIVQCARLIPAYRLARSQILLPNMHGVAFDPDPGFAFTPAQMTGRNLVMPNHLLSTKNVGNFIS